MQRRPRPGQESSAIVTTHLGRAAIVAAVTRHAHGPQASRPRAEKRRWRSCWPPVVLLLVGSALALGPARADEPPAIVAPAEANPTPVSSTPTFVIEKIVIAGVRHGSERIVAAETLLTIGRSYTEKQLQEALHRVERLPFVVEADFALRKGTERGRFELVITVVETKPLFLGGTLGVAGSSGRSSARYWDVWHVGLLPELGGRIFVGGQSEISLTLNGLMTFDDGVSFTPGCALRYTHHNLLGRHLVGSVSLGADKSLDRDAGYLDRLGSVALALPLSRTSIVKGGVSLRRTGYDSGLLGSAQDGRRSADSAELGWQSDTTDDPFAPRSGRRLAATLSHVWGHSDQPLSIWAFEPEKNQRLQQDRRGFAASVSATWFWPLASRLSLGVGGSLSAGETRSEGSVVQGEIVQHGSGRSRSADGGLDLTLRGTLPSGPGTACWWELRGSLYGSGYENDVLQGPYASASGQSSSALVRLGVAYRGRWGIARLAVSYRHGLHESYETR